MLERLTKEWQVGSHIVMNSYPMFPGDKPLMSIGYKYISHKFLGFISTWGGRSTKPSGLYISVYHDNFCIVSFIHVLCPRVIGSYFSACNSIDNHNRMRLSNLAIDNYWLEHSVYFRLATTVVLGMV